MEASKHFPPPPRDMYRHRSDQRGNRQYMSDNSNRAVLPPMLPDRKPETKLFIRSTRPAPRIFTSTRNPAVRDHTSNDLQHRQHVPQHSNKSYHSNNNNNMSQNLRTREITQRSPHMITSPNNNHLVYTGQRHMTHSAERSPQMDATLKATNSNMILQKGPVLKAENNPEVRLRKNRSQERGTLPSQSLLSLDRGGRSSGAFHAVQRLSQPEDFFSQFKEPSNGAWNRSSMICVSPSAPPVLQKERGRVDHLPTSPPRMYEHHLMLRQQQQQQRFYMDQSRLELEQENQKLPPTNNQARSTQLITTNNNKLNHFQHQRDQSTSTSSQPQQGRLNLPPTPSVATSCIQNTSVSKSETNGSRIDQFHPSSSPPPTVNFVGTRPHSSPLSAVPSEISIFTKPGSSQNATLLIRPSPVTLIASKSSNQLSSLQKLCLIDSNQQPYPYRLVDFQPIDNPRKSIHLMESPLNSIQQVESALNSIQQVESPLNSIHQVESPLNSIHQVESVHSQLPPPAPPLRISTLLPSPPKSQQTPTSNALSPKPAPPGGQQNCVSRDGSDKPTAEDLARVKLRAVPGRSQHAYSPVSSRSVTTEAVNAGSRSTPGKVYNTYAQEETTLPPPPALLDFDELPPPPPPHELLFHDIPTSDSLDASSTSSLPALQHTAPHPPQLPRRPRIPAGEANSSAIPHEPSLQQTSSLPKRTHQDTLSKEADILSATGSGAKTAGNTTTATTTTTSLDGQMSQYTPTMDLDVPDDIDLSQCPGLVEITNSTPNWKRDMIEKKNQEKIEEYVKKLVKEREQEAKWKNVPEWKKKILQKKDDEPPSAAPSAQPEAQQATKKVGKKPAKKPPVPPPKESKEDLAALRPKGDIVPAALSIDPEELAAMPPWKRELLFKRDKVPVTFSNEFNPEETSTADNENTTGS